MEEQLRTLAQMQTLDDEIGRYRVLQKELPKQLNEIIESVEQATAILLEVETQRAEINKKQHPGNGHKTTAGTTQKIYQSTGRNQKQQGI